MNKSSYYFFADITEGQRLLCTTFRMENDLNVRSTPVLSLQYNKKISNIRPILSNTKFPLY